MNTRFKLPAIIALILAMTLMASFCLPTIALAADTAVTNGAAQMYSTASTSGKKVTVVPAGSKVTIIGYAKTFAKVKYGSKSGYILAKYVSGAVMSGDGLGIIGQITINGTKVDYPVVVAKDNKWYLDRDHTGKKNVNGAIFLDYRCRDYNRRRNLILYGHNMKSGAMFQTLHNFEKEATFTQYTKVYVEMFNRKYDYEIICAGTYNVDTFNHSRTQFANDADFVGFINKALEFSQYKRAGYTPAASDKIITLSTCVDRSKYKDYTKYKYVVFARQVADNGLVSSPVL